MPDIFRTCNKFFVDRTYWHFATDIRARRIVGFYGGERRETEILNKQCCRCSHEPGLRILEGFMRDRVYLLSHSLWICLFMGTRILLYGTSLGKNFITVYRRVLAGTVRKDGRERVSEDTYEIYKINLGSAHMLPRQTRMTKSVESSFADLFITTVTMRSRDTRATTVWIYGIDRMLEMRL